MKNVKKYSLIVAMVLIGSMLLVGGNAGAVIVAPPASTVVVGAMPAASPMFGSGISSGVVIGPRPFFGFPFFGFPFFNPFFDVDPFFGFAD